MKSRKRLNRYNAFKQKTKDLCSQLKENTIMSDCISAIPIYNVRIFQNGVIKMDAQKPNRSNSQCEVFGIDGNDNIIGSKESLERAFAISITNNIKNFN